MRSIRSRQVHLAGIFGMLALFGAGCGGGGGHNPVGPGPETGYASVAWSIFNIENNSTLACADIGASSVVVTLMNLTTGVSYSQATVSCVTYQMSTAAVPTGDYTVGFDLYGDPSIYGNSTTLLDTFDLADSNGTTVVFHLLSGLNDLRTYTAPFVAQYLDVSWNIYFQGALSSCAAEGASFVDLEFAIPGSPTWITSSLACNPGAGRSYAIPYDSTFARPTSVQWRMYLVDAAGNDITSIPGATVGVPTTTNVHLAPQNFSL